MPDYTNFHFAGFAAQFLVGLFVADELLLRRIPGQLAAEVVADVSQVADASRVRWPTDAGQMAGLPLLMHSSQLPKWLFDG